MQPTRRDNLASGSSGFSTGQSRQSGSGLHSGGTSGGLTSGMGTGSGGIGSAGLAESQTVAQSSGFVQSGLETRVEKEIVRDRVTFDIVREVPKTVVMPNLSMGGEHSETVRAEAVTAPTGVEAQQNAAMTITATGAEQQCLRTNAATQGSAGSSSMGTSTYGSTGTYNSGLGTGPRHL